jgi:hypothetical protein
MNIFQHRYRDWLVPYVEGTLDARRRAKLEARLAQDPILAAEAEAERRVAARLRETVPSLGSTAGEQGEQSLWPSIQARLEPRRPSIRPLILVGGLSAATATLIGAALWGPLKPSPPVANITKIASGNGVSPVIIVIPPPVRTAHRPPHIRHGENNRGKRNAVPHSLTVPEPGHNPDETQQQDRLAVNQSGTSDGTGADGSAIAPRFTPNSGDFRLTTNQHPGKNGTAPDGTSPDTNAAQGSNDAPQEGTNSNDAPPAHSDSTAPVTTLSSPVVSSDGTVSKTSATSPHHRRHRRRGHTTHTPAASASKDSKTAAGSTGASSSPQDAPSPPKAGNKPVD